MTVKKREEQRQRRHQRVRAHVSGTPARPRLNVFRSLTHIYAQVIDDLSGTTVCSASTVDPELKTDMAGKRKTEQAKVVGRAVAARAKAKGVTQVVFDRGGYQYHGRIKALADGAREGGLEF